MYNAQYLLYSTCTMFNSCTVQFRTCGKSPGNPSIPGKNLDLVLGSLGPSTVTWRGEGRVCCEGAGSGAGASAGRFQLVKRGMLWLQNSQLSNIRHQDFRPSDSVIPSLQP